MPIKTDTRFKQIQKLTIPLTSLKGVGAKRTALLAQKGLRTILDLLFFTPIRYEDRTRISRINNAEEGVPVLIKGKVVYGREEKFFPSRKRLFKILIRDDENRLDLLWFQYKKPYLSRLSIPNMELIAYGAITRNRGKRQMVHPQITLLDNHKTEIFLGFYPVYSSVKGLSPNILRSLISTALKSYLPAMIDPLPREMTRLLGLPDLAQAIKSVHFPPRDASIDKLNQCDTPFHRRLIFDRFFLVMLTLAFIKKVRENRSRRIFQVPPTLMNDLERFFPFRLTDHQIKAIEDIINDLTGEKPMNRLLMGDVGCGKTVIAAVAAHITAYNHSQVAIMAPTQILANQHMEYFSSLSHKMGFQPVLLTGELRRAERKETYDKIRGGVYNLIIGTHSLIQEKLSFQNLGLVIIDEQHRFGVRERALMERKGENPHLLVMTATPIPRTLAITVYGDMDISTIKGYPKGHKSIATYLIPEEKKRTVFETLIRRLSVGQQAFVICPVIEESEEMDLKNAIDMFEKLKNILTPPYRIGLIHGRLSSEDRIEVMENFRKGLFHVLVGTTVIEVGVHVPKATVMVIEHPERFGLAQLHQLRGRVGREAEEGICFLMVSQDLSESAISRLKILAENNDGFRIAQKDLECRGHGELIGMRQAGIGEMDLTEIMRSSDLLSVAKREAQRLIETDPELSHPENRHLRVMVDAVLARPLDL